MFIYHNHDFGFKLIKINRGFFRIQIRLIDLIYQNYSQMERRVHITINYKSSKSNIMFNLIES